MVTPRNRTPRLEHSNIQLGALRIDRFVSRSGILAVVFKQKLLPILLFQLSQNISYCKVFQYVAQFK